MKRYFVWIQLDRRPPRDVVVVIITGHVIIDLGRTHLVRSKDLIENQAAITISDSFVSPLVITRENLMEYATMTLSFYTNANELGQRLKANYPKAHLS